MVSSISFTFSSHFPPIPSYSFGSVFVSRRVSCFWLQNLKNGVKLLLPFVWTYIWLLLNTFLTCKTFWETNFSQPLCVRVCIFDILIGDAGTQILYGVTVTERNKEPKKWSILLDLHIIVIDWESNFLFHLIWKCIQTLWHWR